MFASNKNTGTTGAQFLKIGAGARPVGMGEAFTALADDVNAVAWNPAGLGKLTSPEFTAMHTQWFQDSDYEFVAAAYPSKWGTFGIGMASFAVDKIEKRLADTDVPDGTFESKDAAYTLSYGLGLGEDWAAGVNAKYLRQSLDGRSATGLAADLGGLWRTPHRPLSLGLTVRHLGSEVKFVDEGDPLPLTITLGASYKLFQDRLSVGLDLRQPKDNDLQYGVGTEYVQPCFWDLKGSLRAGYNSAGTDPTDELTGISIGAGLAWRSWGFDAAWVPYGVLGQTFRYAFLVKF
ncbi:MAG TPA: PorV/PorQ family protein [Elusimicrobiota bacterium]|nr:PorV/PorQ family protein [Elusimicrobiota bacterium]